MSWNLPDSCTDYDVGVDAAATWRLQRELKDPVQDFRERLATIATATLPCAQPMVECPECESARVNADRYCFTCEGRGEVTPEAAAAYLEDLARGPHCDFCDEPSDDLKVVEDRDDEVGYHATSELCGNCRRAPLQREAEMYGCLRPDALALLGVDEAWMHEGSRPDIPQEYTAVPGKPPARAVLPAAPQAGEFEEPRFGIGGGR